MIVTNNSVTIYIYLAFRSRCFGLFCGLRFSDNEYIYWLFLLLLHRIWWRLFCLISCWRVGFCWETVFTEFWANRPRIYYQNSLFVEDLRMGKLGGGACILRCLYFFLSLFIICLFIICLYIYFLFTLRELFIRSCIISVVQRCEGGRVVWGSYIFQSCVAILVK